ncbi:hemagglutinin [Xylella fastidiosa]|uniref:hemagglutinin n=1 Tax=Xylella fastidiosa TaxID=2371 RepID=UPI000A9FB663|nr:hemagglutinin [Xylella fastidiosa]UIX82464.1 hemagglutinin [Xylella fastidiosa subsp. sandyi]
MREMSGTARAFQSQQLSDQQIKDYANKLAGITPLKEIRPGIYVSKQEGKAIIQLRSVFSSQQLSEWRWVMTCLNFPDFMAEVSNRKAIEIIFR